MPNKYDYDAIIIGAGIGGLVCGCYLAKAGLKTLIVEKNAKPGGYCTSFTRDGFHFDACAHGLSSLRSGGKLRKIITDLELEKKLDIVRHNPSDIIITPHYKIKIFSELDKTIKEFQRCFPKEKRQIEKFFVYMASKNTLSLAQLRSRTFEQLLNYYFYDKSLKSIFSTFTLGLLGLAPSQTSATVAALLYKEFIFDGGYYPSGGMQSLPDNLVKQFLKFKGEISFLRLATKIKLVENKVKGITLDSGKFLSSKFIVAACDARQVFFEMIGKKNLNKKTINKISNLHPSISAFLVYLGIKKDLTAMPDFQSNIWVINNCDINKIILNMRDFKNDSLILTFPSLKDRLLNKKTTSCCLEANTFYKNEGFWSQTKRNQLERRFIKIAQQIIPDLPKYIDLKLSATPLILRKWTRNYRGSAFGWASTPEQFCDPEISQKTAISNLYLAGHWSNQSSGVSFVANCGYDTAKMVLQKVKRL